MMAAGKWVLPAAIVPMVDAPLNMAAMIAGFGACMYSLKHWATGTEIAQAVERYKASTVPPPAGDMDGKPTIPDRKPS